MTRVPQNLPRPSQQRDTAPGKVLPVALTLSVLALSIAASVSAQTRYIAFGDSITEGVGDDAPLGPESGYPIRLAEILAPDTVENRGFSGEDTSELLVLLNAVLLEGGDVMLLMAGTNDVARGFAPEDTLFNLRQIARRAENNGMEVVQATIIPRLPNATRDPENHSTKQLNQSLRNAAGFDDRRLVDNFEAFLSLDLLYHSYYWQTTNPRDPVGHPNAAGYDVMAQTFADVLQGIDSAPPVNGTTDPTDGTFQVLNQQTVRVDVWDFGNGIDLDQTRLLINGVESPATPEGDSRFVTLSHSPERLQGPVRERLQTQDRSAPPTTFDREISLFYTRGTDFPRADFDRNGRVDGLDLIRFAAAFGARSNEAVYFADADFDGDLDIDGADLAEFAAAFGSVAQ